MEVPGERKRLRTAAGEDDRAVRTGRAPTACIHALAALGTDAETTCLEEAPLLIAIFAQRSGTRPDGRKVTHYYVPESVGIATGFLIAALHTAGLATLTHTPSPMGFLNEICARPSWEKPTILLVVGYPKEGCRVPHHGGLRKPLDEISSWI
ncbi:MAG: nitroreductase [Reyranella sp.]|nr:nitroreductase [Reyranella sp.]